MKKMLLVAIVVFGLAFHSTSGSIFYGNSLAKNDFDTTLTYLIVGFDDAAENTDAMILVNYDVSKNSASLLQIPRDTYYNFGASQNKINQIYSTARYNGAKPTVAMSGLVSAIETVFGIEIDGYAGFTTDAFARLVDNLGGIDIYSKSDFEYKDNSGETRILLKAGVNHLTGEKAKAFVRFRSGYAMGDLGRVDAQKLFLSALLSKLKTELDLKLVYKLMSDSKQGVVTNAKVSQFVKILTKKSGRISEMTTFYVTLPGKSAKADSGVWYYFLNKPASLVLLDTLGFDLNGEFDVKELMKYTTKKELTDIYFDENITPTIYDDKSLSELKIIKNN